MHILAILGVIVGGIAIWYWRFKMLGEAGRDVADMVGRARGAYRMGQFRKKVAGSPLASIEGPSLAAGVFLYALAKENRATLHLAEPIIRRQVGEIVPADELDELLSYAEWASRDVTDPRDVVRRFKPLWREKLSREERFHLTEMAEEIVNLAGAEAEHNQKLSFATLRTALGPDRVT
jgi:hypothetical protein